MGEVNKSLIEVMCGLQSDVQNLDTSDSQAVVSVGLALEQAVSDVPEGMTSLVDLLGLCLEGMQAIYEDSVSDVSRLAAGIAAALAASEQALSLGVAPASECILRGAASVVWSAMDRDVSECPYNEVSMADTARKASVCSLDDAAAMLVQMEVTDTGEMVDLRRSLEAISDGGTLTDDARKLVTQAVEALGGIVEGSVPDADEALSLIGRCIEGALDIQEGFEEKGSLAPASEPTVKVAAPPTVVTDTAGAASDRGTLPADADPDLIGEFITECREYIESSEAALLLMETNPEDMEAVNTVFRAFHTIKGTSAFLGLDRISELAHKAESLLSRVRDQEIRCTGGYADLALRSADTLKELIQGVQDALGGAPMTNPQGYDELIGLLIDPEGAGITDQSVDTLPVVPRLGDILVTQGAAARQDVELAEVDKGGRLIGESIVASESATVTDVAKALRTQKKMGGAESGVESSVRVRTDRLDRLIDMVGELVIAQSIVAQDENVILSGHHDLSKKVIHMGKIVRELQYLSMSMRMVPLKASFQKMARLVRDVAHKSGKHVEFITDGEETEIDRNMVDIINDPLVHMVRNAVDHGIESPDDRENNGKSRTGHVRLSAFHSGGNVVVEMRDDGKGLSRDKIVEKAIAKGLIESDKGMSDTEVYNLIFEPGFSTAEKVTDISGRGVGLDVVKRNVEAIRGRIEINSEPGNGCTFSMRLPLTLAVTDGMLVRVGAERFIIPTISIHKSIRPDPELLSTVTGRCELVMLRGELMPVFRLHRLLGVDGAEQDPTKALLVVLDDGDKRCALLVDELLGQYHVVAKSLGDGVGKIPGISGGAILGDGKVGLIIDVSEVVSLARQAPAETRNEAHCRVAA
jgi:two-component system chemotaxis sensor kinase CheA